MQWTWKPWLHKGSTRNFSPCEIWLRHTTQSSSRGSPCCSTLAASPTTRARDNFKSHLVYLPGTKHTTTRKVIRKIMMLSILLPSAPVYSVVITKALIPKDLTDIASVSICIRAPFHHYVGFSLGIEQYIYSSLTCKTWL